MKIVAKIENGQDRRQVLCTTYQMRNCFRQFADGVASELDVHCYFQHAYAADLLPKNGRVLDVCCGRGLLIPFLRYRGNPPSVYVGVDIHPGNAKWREGADPRREGESKTDWGFPLLFVESNVDSMAGPIREKTKGKPFNLIVFTSAIEHMQPTSQAQSLRECRKVSEPGTVLYLTCPVTPKGQDGYRCQYAAHVYEPNQAELQGWLSAAGWQIVRMIGLSTGAKHFREKLSGNALAGAEAIYRMMPREQALPTIAALYPAAALEIAFVCQAV